MELTVDQTQAISNGEAVPVAVNETACVILRKDVFDRVRYLIYDDSELTREEMKRMLAKVGSATGWEEPEMDAYDNYDEELKKRCQ